VNPELVNKWLLGDNDAHIFCAALWDLCLVWDDLIDKDKPISDTDINTAFISALITIPRNPFYQKNMHELVPIMQTYIYDWLDANAMEAEAKSEIAYVIRSGMGNIVTTCARLVGGDIWARSISLEVRTELYGNENYQQYLGEE
jgi:hypothetical protein